MSIKHPLLAIFFLIFAYSQAQNYGNRKLWETLYQGSSQKIVDDTYYRIKGYNPTATKILATYAFQTNGITKILVISGEFELNSDNEIKDCFGCKPELTLFVVALVKGKYVIEKSKNIGDWGKYGKGPDEIKRTVIKGKPAIKISNSVSRGGDLNTYIAYVIMDSLETTKKEINN